MVTKKGYLLIDMNFSRSGEPIEVGPKEKMFTKPHLKKTEDGVAGRFGKNGL